MKQFIFLALLIFAVTQVFAQKRTTNVKGYYRKDGTYVSPHTRQYNAGSGSSSTSSYYSSTSTSTKNNVPVISNSTLSFSGLEELDYASSTSKNKYEKGSKIIPGTLTLKIDEKDNINNVENNVQDGVVIYLSVIKYNGNVIDICPVTRGYNGEWDFNKVHHQFYKNIILPEEALELISNYGWSIAGQDDLRKDFSYDYISSKGLPKYLVKTIEAIKLK